MRAPLKIKQGHSIGKLDMYRNVLKNAKMKSSTYQRKPTTITAPNWDARK